MTVSPDLIKAYCAALYDVELSEGDALALHVDVPNAALDALLDDYGANCAALITAHNPRSEPQSDDVNASAHELLVEAVSDRMCMSTRGRDPEGAWAPEPGLLIFGMSSEEGLALAQRFHQNAFVFVVRGEAPRLILTDRS